MKTRLFMNTENDTFISIDELKALYKESNDELHKTFESYMNDCLGKNGSLKEVDDIRFLNMEEDRIITLNELYDDYELENDEDEDWNTLPENVKSFADYVEYRERKNYDEMFMIEESINNNSLSLYEMIDYLMNEYGFNPSGAYYELAQLIDDDLWNTATKEDIDRLTVDYIDR